MKIRTLTLFLSLLCLVACGTIQVGIEFPSSITNTMAAPATIEPTLTPIPPAVTSPATAIPPTPTPIATNTPTGPQMVKIFLIAVGDNGISGPMIGCGDSLVPVDIEVAPTQGVLRASLTKLLSLKDAYYGQSGLYDALYQSDLQIDSITLEGGEAFVQLSGSMMLGGECDNPRVSAQLEATAKQFPTVSEVTFYINGKLLADALSLK